jgi:hypothetical protein
MSIVLMLENDDTWARVETSFMIDGKNKFFFKVPQSV